MDPCGAERNGDEMKRLGDAERERLANACDDAPSSQALARRFGICVQFVRKLKREIKNARS